LDHKPFDMLISSVVIAFLLVWSASKIPDLLQKTHLTALFIFIPHAVAYQVEDLAECVGAPCQFKAAVDGSNFIEYDEDSITISEDGGLSRQVTFTLHPADPTHNTSFWMLRCDENNSSKPTLSICRRLQN
jgi:hypothetical protein